MVSRPRFIALIALLAVTSFAACGDDSATAPAMSEPAAVLVSPEEVRLDALGSTSQLTAQVLGRDGQPITGVAVTWSSNSASAAVDSAGVVTAVGNGESTITAAVSGASGTVTVTVASSDRAVLEALYKATDGPNWINKTNWLTDRPLGEWFGVATDSTGVVQLRLPKNGLSGSIPPDLGLLKSLRMLDLSSNAAREAGSQVAPDLDQRSLLEPPAPRADEERWNDAPQPSVEARWAPESPIARGSADVGGRQGGLRGPIPAELGDLDSLEILYLHDNDLNGPIPPELGRLAVLTALSLWNNALSGPIPAELGNLANLTTLALSGNELDGGIPPVLGDLVNLRYLDITRNRISGQIPAEIGNLANLTTLALGGNELEGEIPPVLGDLVSLQRMYLWGNKLSGPIPESLVELRVLEALSIGDNGLSGPIPPELGDLASLRNLSLNRNDLNGPIPPELGDLESLETLYLYDNDLTGPIPPELGEPLVLRHLFLWGNRLSGPIPAELGNLASLTRLYLSGNELSGQVPVELGGLSALGELLINNNDLSGPIPPELGDLASLRNLSVNQNDLTGPIPVELGDLANLEVLSLWGNDFSGIIPQSFLQLGKLRFFWIGFDASLCVPGTSAFLGWLRRIESRDDESESLCNAVDVAVLKELYEATGGSEWTESAGWPGDGAVEDWHGVSADSLGRVKILDLTGNGLAGELPGSLGELASMTELRIADNGSLSGRVPLSLALVSLQTLHYTKTGLCTPADAPFQDWLSAISSHQGTGTVCAPLPDRDILTAVYEAMDGPNWVHSEKWLTDAPLAEWYGVKVDGHGRVVELGFFANGLSGQIPRDLVRLGYLESLTLYRNNLTGPIPSELGRLVKLRELWAGENQLTGPIPPELGDLANLQGLSFNENNLVGPIPPEFGNLANLRWINLSANRLTGSIPVEFGELANLVELTLGRNDLTGPIPSELGNLASLWQLNLATNRLTGPIPVELGGLAALREAYLGFNELTGPLPAEFGSLTNLRRLALQANAGMSGVLPAGLTQLGDLETLQLGGTDLCAPSHEAFVDWLEGVPNRRVAACDGEPPAAYLVQAVQSRLDPVPLVAGEEALLRVFVTAGEASGAGIPAVRARFYVNDAEIFVKDIPGKLSPIPTQVDESSLGRSANAVIPGRVVRPGLEMVIEVDPNGTLDPGLGVAERIPESGRLAIDVRDMPLFDLTLVPFLWSEAPDSVALEAARGMAADPGGHEMLGPTRNLLPVGELKVTAHEPVLSSSNNAYDLINQTRAIRVMEGATGYWMGTMSGGVTGALGLGGGVASFSVPHAGIIAHEFGHNFSLPHAPCGGAVNPDPAYPTQDGTIGVWGYDFEARRLVPPTAEDIMGACDDDWINDYFFTKALLHRIAEGTQAAAAVARPSRTLLLWGGTNSDGELHLNPAFVVDAPPTLPRPGGEYALAGRDGSGRELFALRFDMPETADGDGSASFAFGLPVDPAWAGELASVTLSGPNGSVALDAETTRPMAILLDPGSGRVRGFLRDVPPESQVVADAVGQVGGGQFEVLYSRGIPDAAAWRR